MKETTIRAQVMLHVPFADDEQRTAAELYAMKAGALYTSEQAFDRLNNPDAEEVRKHISQNAGVAAYLDFQDRKNYNERYCQTIDANDLHRERIGELFHAATELFEAAIKMSWHMNSQEQEA